MRFSLFFFVVGFPVCSFSPVALGQTAGNLLSLADVREAGTYTYYACGNAARKNIPPFTRRFYPGGGGLKPQGLHASDGGGMMTRDGVLTDTGDNAAPVPIKSGELTDGVIDRTKGGGSVIVSGWINTLSRGEVSATGANTGQFDILFDLGKVCHVTKVVLWVRDQAGHRWVGEQECMTAESFAKAGQPAYDDFRFFASATIPGNATSKVELKGSPRQARYVDLRLSASVSRWPGPTASMGGILYEVEIHGAR